MMPAATICFSWNLNSSSAFGKTRACRGSEGLKWKQLSPSIRPRARMLLSQMWEEVRRVTSWVRACSDSCLIS
jgi:hypothetical protein